MDKRNNSIINKVASDKVIDEAFCWLCKSRKNYHFNNDIWFLRSNWKTLKPQIQERLVKGMYRFEPVKRIRTQRGYIYLWTSMDALVLKALAIVLNPECRPFLGSKCYHITGMGGGKGAVRDVQKELHRNKYVFKSDVESYYASINHSILINQVKKLVKDRFVLDLIYGYLEHLVDEDALLRTIKQGVHFGCPLSPLMGAIYLKPLDDAMDDLDVFYARYMDDWIILAETRWKLKRAVKRTNQILESLKVRKHPFKTYLGRTAYGFDFLGYRLKSASVRNVSVAFRTVTNHLEKIVRLYEQGADIDRIGQYLRGWWKWLRSGVELKISSIDMKRYRVMVRKCLGVEIWLGEDILSSIRSEHRYS